MEEKDGIKIGELFQALLKRWYIIFVTVILGVAVTGILAFVVITPKYKSTSEILVHSYYDVDNQTIDFNNTNRMIATIAGLLESEKILEDVVEKLDVDGLTVLKIKSGLDITFTTTVFYIKVNFTHTSPELSKRVAQQVVDSAEELFNDGVSFGGYENSITKLNSAKEGKYVSPNKTLYLIVGFLIGAVIGAAIVFFLEFATYTYKDKNEIEADLNIQVIGVIPEYSVVDKYVPNANSEEEL